MHFPQTFLNWSIVILMLLPFGMVKIDIDILFTSLPAIIMAFKNMSWLKARTLEMMSSVVATVTRMTCIAFTKA